MVIYLKEGINNIVPSKKYIIATLGMVRNTSSSGLTIVLKDTEVKLNILESIIYSLTREMISPEDLLDMVKDLTFFENLNADEIISSLNITLTEMQTKGVLYIQEGQYDCYEDVSVFLQNLQVEVINSYEFKLTVDQKIALITIIKHPKTNVGNIILILSKCNDLDASIMSSNEFKEYIKKIPSAAHWIEIISTLFNLGLIQINK